MGMKESGQGLKNKSDYLEEQASSIVGGLIVDLASIMKTYSLSPDEKIERARKECRIFDKKYNPKIQIKHIDKMMKEKNKFEVE